ncbi:type IV pilin protein [Variovorax sp. W1I1]|uniref:type IV pilin protein n=1 Tax=Variovorax sp. W1I1 TaxID=3042309 RepID=UPI0027D8A7FD|nr:type IV pilin protein [Variovorax sp. W1I1]
MRYLHTQTHGSKGYFLMKQQSATRPTTPTRYASGGFTLIEVMVTVVIVAILAAVGIPNYVDYVRRGNIQDAVGSLSNHRTQMEQYYQDHRNYANGTDCGISVPATTVNFSYSCALGGTSQTYTTTATGRTGSKVAGFAYTINEQGTQGSTCTGCAWGFSAQSSTWVLRKP